MNFANIFFGKHCRQSLSARLSLLVGLLVTVALVLPAPEAVGAESTEIPICLLYTVGQQPGHRSQIIGLDLPNTLSYPLTDVVEGEIRGLAVHPHTSVLYAVSDKWGRRPGLLCSVDRTTGEFTSIGAHGFNSITALAFRWTDSTLWGWAKETGLVQLDIDTGAASLHYASDQEFTGLAWANDGSVLYAVSKTSLWAFDEATGTLDLVANNLPLGTSAIEMRSDDVLVGIARRLGPIDRNLKEKSPLLQAWPFIYDPAAGQLVSQHAIPVDRVYPGFAGLAWSRACGNASPGGPADIIQNITLDKTEICPGEEILVTVEVEHPESPHGVVDVAVNGRPGNPQYVQFTGWPSSRTIMVTATTPEQFYDSEDLTVEVVECEDHEFLEVSVRPNPFHQHKVDFQIVNYEDFFGQSPAFHWSFGDGKDDLTTVPYASH